MINIFQNNYHVVYKATFSSHVYIIYLSKPHSKATLATTFTHSLDFILKAFRVVKLFYHIVTSGFVHSAFKVHSFQDQK